MSHLIRLELELSAGGGRHRYLVILEVRTDSPFGACQRGMLFPLFPCEVRRGIRAPSVEFSHRVEDEISRSPVGLTYGDY